MSDKVSTTSKTTESAREPGGPQTIALRLIAGLLVTAAAWWTSYILAPFVLALLIAIALTPLANRLERIGFPRTVASLACVLLVLAFVTFSVGLVVYETGMIAKDTQKYIDKFSGMLDSLAKRTHSGPVLASLGMGETDEPGEGAEEPAVRSESHGDGGPPPATGPDWKRVLRRGAGAVGGWAVRGVGGLMGVIGGAILVFAALFYMLEGRGGWIDSLTLAARRLGMTPRPELLKRVRSEVVTFAGFLALVSSCYVVVVSLVLWMIGVPYPILWGLIAGLFEVVPFFGPLIASVLPTAMALSLESWWQPVAVIGLFLTLNQIEGYIIAPVVYGRAVKLDPVTILFGAVFFGWLWGPVGLAVATPMIIVLRGLILIAPNTPVLDALADIDEARDDADTREPAHAS